MLESVFLTFFFCPKSSLPLISQSFSGFHSMQSMHQLLSLIFLNHQDDYTCAENIFSLVAPKCHLEQVASINAVNYPQSNIDRQEE